VTDGMIGGMSVTSDANGSVTIKGLNTTANIANATYINIHEAAAPSVIPLCADLTKK
jgi:superoxide dismutase, Cu-Zn family